MVAREVGGGRWEEEIGCLMSDDAGGVIHGASEGGVAGKHPPADPFQILVGPSTSGEFNTARLRLIPVACWRVDDIRFHFGSSFVTPEIETELRHLASLVHDHSGCPLAIFGHADPVGSDDYNKGLSGRRAAVIYGMLTRDTGLWEHLYSSPFKARCDGPARIQTDPIFGPYEQ
jgi:hypothetical protein